MLWEPTSHYTIRCGEYRISKVYVRGEKRFELWRGGWTKLGWSHDLASMKALAERDKAEREASDEE